MVTITNFQEWLDDLDNNSIEDIYNLYESIIGVTSIGGFTCFQKNGIFHLQTDDHSKILILLDGKSVKAFLDKLDNDHGGDKGWVGGHFYAIRNKGAIDLI
jgi:hypothetical protein